MTAKNLLFGTEAQRALERGVAKLARSVAGTLGPRGRLVVIQRSFGAPLACDDGATIAKEIELEDPFEDLGAKLAREVASKTNDDAGDGTTTATLLAGALVKEGVRNVAAGADPIAIRNGIQHAVEAVVAELKSKARKVESNQEIRQVATIAARDPAIGQTIAEAMEKIGRDGVITVEEGQSLENQLEVVDGMQFDHGYLSPYFVTDPQAMEATLDDPLILLHEGKLSNLKEVLPVLEKVVQAGSPLLVIADEVESEVLATLVVNRLRGALRCAAVKAPGFGDRRKAMLQDMAILTGGQVVSEDLGHKLEKLGLEVMGKARKVSITKEATTIVGGKGDKKAILGRIAQLRREIEDSTSSYDKEKLQERLGKLSGGVAIFRVGAATEAEMKEKKLRIDDALGATRAAVEEGIVPGGGTALLSAIPVLEKLTATGDEATGVKIVRLALEMPIRTIAKNSGFDGSVVVGTLQAGKDPSKGFDAAKGSYVDMWAAGIVDPVKVTRTALQNAASIASIVLLSDVLVVERKDPPEKKAGHGAGGMEDFGE